jgi:CHAD domain-containing protein
VAYQIENDEGVRPGLLRCTDEQLDRAVDELTTQVTEDPVGAVHSARKAVKKERSLLRLVRGAMNRDQRRRENAALREAAVGLSAARDAEAMLATLQALSERYAGQLPGRTFAQIRARLEERRDRERAELVDSGAAGQAADALHAVRARRADWTLARGGWKALEPGLLRTYRDGRALCSRARADRSSARWHEWRKRVKDLWYQERLLAPGGGHIVKGHVKEAHRLADLLGDDHDLGVLRQTLQDEPTPPVDLDALLALIDHRRDELQTEALHLGGRIYHEAPKRFVRRMRSAWRCGRAAARAQRAQHPAKIADAVRTSS